MIGIFPVLGAIKEYAVVPIYYKESIFLFGNSIKKK